MKSLLITPRVILTLLVRFHAGADFARRVVAYQVGDLATAVQEFKRAAEYADAES